MKRTNHAVNVALMAGMLACVAVAYGNTTWQCNRSKNTSDVGNGSAALKDMSYWTNSTGQVGSGLPTASDDLIFDQNAAHRLRINCNTSGEFKGNSLQIGTDSIGAEVVHDSGVFKCVNEGLKLKHGNWWFNGAAGYTLNTDVEILAEDETKPFVMHIGQYQYSNGVDSITGALKGSANAQLLLGPWPVSLGGFVPICAQNASFYLYDISAYAGTITVTSKYENTYCGNENRDYGTRLRLYTGTTTSPAKIRISRGGSLSLKNFGDTVTVKELSLACGSRLWLNHENRVNYGGVWCMRATDALTVEKGADKVEVLWKPLLRNIENRRMPILVGPATSTFEKEDFKLTFCAPQYGLEPQLEVDIDPDTGERTLYAVTRQFVYQSSYYTGEKNRDGMDGAPSSITNAAAWKPDGWEPTPANAEAIYLTAKNLRTLYAYNEPYQFPCSGFWLNTGQLIIQTHTFEVPEFWSDGGLIGAGQGHYSPYSTVSLIAPKIHFIKEGGTVTLRAYNSNTLALKGDIDGPGDISMLGWDGTGAPKANFMLDGMNTNYTGSITVQTGETRPAYHNFDNLYPTLYLLDGRNLGGAKAEFDPRALTLTTLARLSVTNAGTVTLADGLNRGVYIKKTGRFYTSAASTLDMKWPVLLSGKMWKEGKGTLVLGGAMKHEETDGGALTDVPRAGSNLFEVVAGTVKIANADALAGVETTIDSGAALQLALDPSNADLTEYGIRNTAVDTPFTLAASFGGKLPLTIDTAGFTPDGCRPMTNALVTVKGTSADAVAGMLSAVRPWRGMGYASQLVHRANADGTTTLLLVSRHTGTKIIFR